MKPLTPLPWSKATGHFQHVSDQDIDYFIHAANAYPRLVAELKRLCVEIPAQLGAKPFSNALLRELGEQ